MKDPPTQAVGNTSPLQKTPDMLRSRAAADIGMESEAKCIQTYLPNIHVPPKNEAVGGLIAPV